MNKVKGMLVTGILLALTGCAATPAHKLDARFSALNTIKSIDPFTLRTAPSVSLEQRDCMRNGSLFVNCQMMKQEETRHMLAEGMRTGLYDQLSDRLFANDSVKKNRNSRWRLKRDRVEWQYKF